MKCPTCQQGMDAEVLPAHYGQTLEVDVCHRCDVIWFDGYELLQLSPEATLKLVQDMHARWSPSSPLQLTEGACPRCGGKCRADQRKQQDASFTVYLCPEKHGFFMTFQDFMRSKGVIKPLSPEKLAALRESIQTISCGSCGAAVDLRCEDSCGHCGSGLALLDPEALGAAIGRLAEDIRRRLERSPEQIAVEAMLAKAKVEEAFARQAPRQGEPRPPDLLHSGLAVLRWMIDPQAPAPLPAEAAEGLAAGFRGGSRRMAFAIFVIVLPVAVALVWGVTGLLGLVGRDAGPRPSERCEQSCSEAGYQQATEGRRDGERRCLCSDPIPFIRRDGAQLPEEFHLPIP